MKIAFLTIVAVYYINCCSAEQLYESVDKSVKTDLDLSRLSGVWHAVYAGVAGFRCLQIQLKPQNDNTIDVSIQNNGRVTDSYKLHQPNSAAKGFLERQENVVRPFPWYVVNTDYVRFLAIYHVVNSNPKNDLWVIYARNVTDTLYDTVTNCVIRLQNVGAVSERSDNLIHFVNNFNCSKP